MVRPDGIVKVLDFGLARFVEPPAEGGDAPLDNRSLPGLVLGTVRYMSPEQANGRAVDGRSDIFSLGVMLYEMATGLPPFAGASPTETLAAILMNDPPPLSRYSPGLPAEFERIVRHCLAKDPAGRYATAQELKDDLTRLATPPGRPAWARPWRLVTACAALAAMAFADFLIDRRQPAVPFNSMQITRLVTRGDATDAALSPDGRLLAYVVDDGSGQSVWIRNRAGSQESPAVQASAGEFSGLAFSPADSFLYYRKRGAEGAGDLYRVPVKGGAPERLGGM